MMAVNSTADSAFMFRQEALTAHAGERMCGLGTKKTLVNGSRSEVEEDQPIP